MSINEIKIDDIREILELFNNNNNNNNNNKKQNNLLDGYIGKYVICRTRNEGVNAGEVIALDETGVILKNARRLYYHKPADAKLSWYEGVAISGVSDDSKLSAPVEKVIIEDYSLTVCTEKAKSSIISAKNNEQS